VLARLHCRQNAPIMLGAHWDPATAARAAVEFATGYAAQVEEDQQAFARASYAVAKELGVA
jgi:hypothetical protein